MFFEATTFVEIGYGRNNQYSTQFDDLGFS